MLYILYVSFEYGNKTQKMFKSSETVIGYLGSMYSMSIEFKHAKNYFVC